MGFIIFKGNEVRGTTAEIAQIQDIKSLFTIKVTPHSRVKIKITVAFNLLRVGALLEMMVASLLWDRRFFMIHWRKMLTLLLKSFQDGCRVIVKHMGKSSRWEK